MSLGDRLRTGELGVRASLPARLTLRPRVPDLDDARDDELEIDWMLVFDAKAHLDLAAEHRAELARALEHYARWEADNAYDNRHDSDEEGQARPPRPTADPTWPAMIDVEYLRIDGAPALRTVHRTIDEPGVEVVVGHLMIPLRRGLFEIRVEATGAPLDPAAPRMQPDAVTRIRFALRIASEDAGLRVLEPAPPGRLGEVELPRLGCALIPPRRFVERPTPDGEAAILFRTSFCAFERTEFFAVNRTGDQPLDADALRRHAEEATRRMHDEGGEVRDLQLVVEDLAPVDGRAQVLVIAECMSGHGPRRNTLRWFLDADGRPWYLAIHASDAVPVATRLVELDEAARSWRPLTRPR